MLQVPNILRRPAIWIAPTIASGVCGAVSAALFQMVSTPYGAGMGTSGLVGQITTYTVMAPEHGAVVTLLLIGFVHFLLPALVTLAIDQGMRRAGWVRQGDMTIRTM